MIVNKDKCIGCTLCQQDCVASDIEMIDEKAHIRNLTCLKCGHCIAICPVNAVSCEDEKEYSMDDVIDYNKEDFEVDADNLMNFMKFRRSVRLFTEEKVEEEKIQKIIEAGKYNQTAINAQDVSYVVVQDKIQEFRAIALETLNDMSDKMVNDKNTPKNLVHYAHKWKQMYSDFLENPNGEDRLFFKAPLLIVIKSKNPINGGLAASKMELMTYALGLGTCFCGFFQRAASANPKIGEMLQLEEGENVITCMLIGYPRKQYKRTVPRKDVKIIKL